MSNQDSPSDNPQQSARRAIYLLPNLFTTGALFAGFYAIVAAMNDLFDLAAMAVFIAMVLDGMDGRVARMTNTQSEFGAQYDSLADMVSFGLAPALVMYEWSLWSLKAQGFPWDKLGWLAAFFYVASAALRLARFNTRIGVQDKRWFQGLPSPAAAAVTMGMVWVLQDMGISGDQWAVAAMLLTVVAGALMISNVSFYSFKDADFRNRVSFMALPALVGLLILAAIDPPKALWLSFGVYALSGPLLMCVRWVRKKRHV